MTTHPTSPSSQPTGSAVEGLSSSGRRRLVDVLGLLGSEHAGERAAAALVASRLLGKAGLAWDDVLVNRTGEPASASKPKRSSGAGNLAADQELCELHADRLGPWEQRFVLSQRYDAKPPGRSLSFARLPLRSATSGLRDPRSQTRGAPRSDGRRSCQGRTMRSATSRMSSFQNTVVMMHVVPNIAGRGAKAAVSNQVRRSLYATHVRTVEAPEVRRISEASPSSISFRRGASACAASR